MNSCTIDNAPNIINAVKTYSDYEDGSTKVILIRCAAHIINLIVQIGFEEPVMSTANEKIRYFCKKIHGSLVHRQCMADQTLHTKEPNIKVELDIPIRWNSTHDMLQSALRVNRAMTALSIQLGNDGQSAMPSIEEKDWATAKNSLLILEPFNQGILKLIKNLIIKYNCFVVATIDLSGDYFGVFGQLNTVFLLLEEHLKTCLSNQLLKNLWPAIKLMQAKFEEYWPLIKDLAIICQLLDPRFKTINLPNNNGKKEVKI